MTKKFFATLAFILTLSFSAYAADSDKVLARVGSEDVTEAEVLESLEQIGQQYGQQAMQQALMFYGTEQGRKMILEDVISMKLFALDGEARKLDQTPEFQEQLKSIKRTMLAQAVMRDAVKDVTVSDDEARKFYDENPSMFKNPERVRASHILVSGDEALAKVQDELKSGKSFDVVAKEYSQDPGSAAHGGDLGEFPRGMMVPEFEKAAFELEKPGQVSEPVKTQFGWHIIKLGEKIPESTIPFEQVKERLIQELRDQKTQKTLQDKSKELEEKYKVQIF